MVYYYVAIAILATLFAVWLMILMPSWFQQSWMHVKLAFVLLLFIYQLQNTYLLQTTPK